MRKLGTLALVLGALTWTVGCEKSLTEEQRDVNEARQEAAEDVREEMRETRDAAQQGAAEIQEEKDDVQDKLNEVNP